MFYHRRCSELAHRILMPAGAPVEPRMQPPHSEILFVEAAAAVAAVHWQAVPSTSTAAASTSVVARTFDALPFLFFSLSLSLSSLPPPPSLVVCVRACVCVRARARVCVPVSLSLLDVFYKPGGTKQTRNRRPQNSIVWVGGGTRASASLLARVGPRRTYKLRLWLRTRHGLGLGANSQEDLADVLVGLHVCVGVCRLGLRQPAPGTRTTHK